MVVAVIWWLRLYGGCGYMVVAVIWQYGAWLRLYGSMVVAVIWLVVAVI
jgi:hypothetical protein